MALLMKKVNFADIKASREGMWRRISKGQANDSKALQQPSCTVLVILSLIEESQNNQINGIT